MKLIDPTDDELNVAFAEKVAGWTIACLPGCGDESVYAWINPAGRATGGAWPQKEQVKTYGISDIPRFTTSADAVLPWIERDAFDVRISFSNTCDTWHVELLGRFTSNRSFKAAAETLPRAAVIALLRAHGVEIEFTQAIP